MLFVDLTYLILFKDTEYFELIKTKIGDFASFRLFKSGDFANFAVNKNGDFADGNI